MGFDGAPLRTARVSSTLAAYSCWVPLVTLRQREQREQRERVALGPSPRPFMRASFPLASAIRVAGTASGNTQPRKSRE